MTRARRGAGPRELVWRPRGAWWGGVLSLACLVACEAEPEPWPDPATPADLCAVEASDLEDFLILNPSGTWHTRRRWSPWVTQMPHTLARGELVACVDGTPVKDEHALSRPGSSAQDELWHHIRTLDVEDLADGAHTLELFVTTEEGTVRAAADVVMTKGPHRVDVIVEDAQGRPSAARVHVERDGRLVPLDEGVLSIDMHARDHPAYGLFVSDGSEPVFLEPGTYRFTGVRDVRDALAEAVVEVPGAEQVILQMVRAVEDDRLAADLHVHTGASFDALIPDPVRFRSLAAAGLDVAVITDHNLVRDGAAAASDVQSSPAHLRTLPGTESDIREAEITSDHSWDWAHVNAFPLRSQPPLPDPRTTSVGALLDAFRVRQRLSPFPGAADALVLQLNHPRGIQFQPDGRTYRGAWPMFNTLGFDPTIPVGVGGNAWLVEADIESTPLDVEAMEILNRFSYDLFLEVRDDWHALLNQGYRITGTGNSDTHAAEVELAGLPVNLIDVPRPAPGEPLDVSRWARAIEDGAVSVSTGPILELAVLSDGRWYRPGEGDVSGATAVRVRVQAAPWVPVPEVRLIANGEVVQRILLPAPRVGESLDWERVWPLSPAQDSWVAAEAGWPLEAHVAPVSWPGGAYAKVAPGYVPVGFTNPVRIDVDGGGWSAPGM